MCSNVVTGTSNLQCHKYHCIVYLSESQHSNAIRERIKQEEQAEAAASVMPKEVDKIVFDAGFFRIESPIKSFSG